MHWAMEKKQIHVVRPQSGGCDMINQSITTFHGRKYHGYCVGRGSLKGRLIGWQ